MNSSPTAGAQPIPPFRPGEVWLDTDGRPIQAHGGGILLHDGVWYWYGENKDGPTKAGGCGARVDVIGVSCYTSTDLVAWKNEGVVLKAVPDDPCHDLHPSKVAERPKVLFNRATGKFVMWLHIDVIDYSYSQAGVAVADSPTGPFTYLGSRRPIGDQTYRDMNLFLDDDGQGYVFYASESNATLYVSRLNAEFTDIERPAVEGQTWMRSLAGESREAPAPFKHAGRYYIVTSGCTGWAPNPSRAAVADSPLGPYRDLGEVFVGPEAETSCRSQSTCVLAAPGQPAGSFIYLGDRWVKENLSDSRYTWWPMTVDGDEVRVHVVPEWDWSVYARLCND